jgi:hypothetical protein
MRKHLFLVIGIVAGLAVGAGGAIAATGARDKPATESAAAEAGGVAAAPGARMAVIIDGNEFAAGGPADFVIIRSVGVQSVTNPAAGTFCIRPKTSAIPTAQVGRLVPSATPIYPGTSQWRAWIQYLTPRPDACPAGTLAFYTFTENGGGALNTEDNNVAFTVVVD